MSTPIYNIMPGSPPAKQPKPTSSGAMAGGTGGAAGLPQYQGLGQPGFNYREPPSSSVTQNKMRTSAAMDTAGSIHPTPPNEPDIPGGPIDRDQLHYQQTGMPEYMQQQMYPESAWGTQPGPRDPDQMDHHMYNKGDFDVNPYGPGGTNLPLDPGENITNDDVTIYDPVKPPVYVPPTVPPEHVIHRPPPPRDPPPVDPPPVDPPPVGPTPRGPGPTGPVAKSGPYSGPQEIRTGQVSQGQGPGGQVGAQIPGMAPPASPLDSQWGYNAGPNYLGQAPDFTPVDRGAGTGTGINPDVRGGPGQPTYQPPGAGQAQVPGVAVSDPQGPATINKPGGMKPETNNALNNAMEVTAGSTNPVDTSMRNVLSEVLEQGTDIDAESLVPRLKTVREQLSSFREASQRRLLSDLSRRGFQLGGAQEAAVLAELEQQITTQTAQSFREIVNDERARADARLTQSMQIAAQQQALAQQLGLSREELAVQARLGYGQEQLGYEQLGLSGEQLAVQARLGYGQERLGQEQLAVQQQLGLGQEQIGRGQLALGQEQLGAQERQAAAEQQLGYQQLNVQERAALGQEALGYAGLDVQQQTARSQAESARQQLAQERAYQQAQIGVQQYGAETEQYQAETARIQSQNDAVLKDLELDQGFQQFLLQMGFDKAAMEASLKMAEEGQAQQLLGMLNNYLATLAQGRVE